MRVYLMFTTLDLASTTGYKLTSYMLGEFQPVNEAQVYGLHLAAVFHAFSSSIIRPGPALMPTTRMGSDLREDGNGALWVTMLSLL